MSQNQANASTNIKSSGRSLPQSKTASHERTTSRYAPTIHSHPHTLMHHFADAKSWPITTDASAGVNIVWASQDLLVSEFVKPYPFCSIFFAVFIRPLIHVLLNGFLLQLGWQWWRIVKVQFHRTWEPWRNCLLIFLQGQSDLNKLLLFSVALIQVQNVHRSWSLSVLNWLKWKCCCLSWKWKWPNAARL